MRRRVFISYSTLDVDKAEQIRAALEAADIPCWISTRELDVGLGWGGSIVQAIQACDAVLVVFSAAANGSPQVAREMELTVSHRKPLIPVRVADDMPTDDMQYFLGVSHWLNAFAKPLDGYLPEIVAAVQNVLAKAHNPWANAMRRMPKSRNGQILLIVAAVLVVGALLLVFDRPTNFAKLGESPLKGRWEARIGAADCIMDIQPQGQTTFSADCPDPLAGAMALISAMKGSAAAPQMFQPGDTGTFFLNNFVGGNIMGAYKTGLFGGLTTRDARLGEVKWRRISAGKALPKGAAGVLTADAQWPLKDVAGLIARADKAMTAKWSPDAVLMTVDLKPGGSGGVDAVFDYYSPGKQQERSLTPNSAAGELSQPAAAQMDVRQAIPARVLDLPDAIGKAGLTPAVVEEAQLGWASPSCGTGNFLVDNAILPKCGPNDFTGMQWELRTSNGLAHIPALP